MASAGWGGDGCQNLGLQAPPPLSSRQTVLPRAQKLLNAARGWPEGRKGEFCELLLEKEHESDQTEHGVTLTLGASEYEESPIYSVLRTVERLPVPPEHHLVSNADPHLHLHNSSGHFNWAIPPLCTGFGKHFNFGRITRQKGNMIQPSAPLASDGRRRWPFSRR
jgi:hypothetical protein